MSCADDIALPQVDFRENALLLDVDGTLLQRHSELWNALLRNDIDNWSDKFLAALTGRNPSAGLEGPEPRSGEFQIREMAAE